MKDEEKLFIDSSLRPSYPVLPDFVRNQDRTRIHPSSFILHPCSSVSAQKFMNVSIVCFAQSFVRAAENYLAVTHHQNLAVDETKLFAFSFENHFAGFVDHRVFRGQII